MPEHEPSATTPLLGGFRRSQPTTAKIWKNPIIDWPGITAQILILALVAIIWSYILAHPVILFTGHPLAQSLAILILTQSVLVLQPTHDAAQKRQGQRVHAVLNLAAFLLLVAGVTIIEVNKFRSHGPHFHSLHGYLGVLVAALIVLQYLVGFTMWAAPSLYGGDDRAKAVWKYHRASGYGLYVALLATVLTAVWTDYNRNLARIPAWLLVVVEAALLVVVVLRVNRAKLPFGAQKDQGTQVAVAGGDEH
ncbi:hypothetical protein VD0004_g4107 [Verticillium dahliae]|uniref:Cytochrome b561 domain-containing protein n=1 Tax=Verticillium dahliae TaxID=27337 RepID=A0A444S137_VERDA|nr:hypothetical protein VD0004_g4107 [Verticillium dahliae]PNH76160.1 hypothetical protein VD0001_g1372 [Verticillium dahliae]RXG47029.1 hypothetical protein VDGE_03909 [Verticillium dahliae]